MQRSDEYKKDSEHVMHNTELHYLSWVRQKNDNKKLKKNN